MSRSSSGGGARAARGAAGARALGGLGPSAGSVASLASVAASLALGGPGGPARAGAQLPARPDSAARADTTARRDTAARRDTTARRDSAARADGAARPVGATRADSAARAAVSDSTRRDSVVARQLRAARRAPAPVTGRLSLDRLRLSSVGATLGLAAPDQVRGTTLYAVNADYGEVARDLRAVFGVMYWSSAFRAGAVEGLARAIAAAAANGGAPPPVTLGRVRASDVALHADLRWRPRILGGWRTPGALRPWISGGGAVHLLDVQGAPLTGTFVERALDGIALGVAGAAGADLLFTPSVRATGQARYDLFNGAHFASVRAGVSYVFDRRRE